VLLLCAAPSYALAVLENNAAHDVSTKMINKFLRRIAFAIRHLQVSEFRLALGKCPFCGPTVFVRLSSDDSGVRCARCAAGLVHLSIGFAIRSSRIEISKCDVCEFSASGPYVEFLIKHSRTIALSEFVDGAIPGEVRSGVRCEDVQNLSYENASFDLVTHTEVMEHVPNDHLGFSELRRVLRKHSLMIFTVPIYDSESTLERAHLSDGVVVHTSEPVFHVDPWRGGAGILAFRDYGRDILERLLGSGFSKAHFVDNQIGIPWIRLRRVVVASS